MFIEMWKMKLLDTAGVGGEKLVTLGIICQVLEELNI